MRQINLSLSESLQNKKKMGTKKKDMQGDLNIANGFLI